MRDTQYEEVPFGAVYMQFIREYTCGQFSFFCELLPLQIFNSVFILWFDPPLMKKLLSVLCCFLYMRSVSHASFDIRMSSSGTSGEKQLVKALTAIVNREGNKKIPRKKINLFSYEYPQSRIRVDHFYFTEGLRRLNKKISLIIYHFIERFKK